jgi:hypothetical protein
MRLRTVAEADEALREAFGSTEVQEQFALARHAGFRDEDIEALARSEADRVSRAEEWAKLAAAIAASVDGDATTAAGRLGLLVLARGQIRQVAALRVDEEVRALLYDEFHFIGLPTRRHRHVLQPGTQPFAAQARLLTFRRLPAGQLHFETSGFPRSWLRNVPLRKLPGTASYLAKMRGFAPLYETHIATRWTVPVVLLPDEDIKSCRRIARTMALNPKIRGLMSSSWMNDPALAVIDPHLAWRFDRLGHGAFLTTIGPAAADSGAASGNPQRAKLIEQGEWQPQTGVMLWRRESFLKWETNNAGRS